MTVVTDDASIATVPATGAGWRFDNNAVGSLRQNRGVPQPQPLRIGDVTVADITRELGITHAAIIHSIARGRLSARRGLSSDQWCVALGPDIEAACRERVASSAHIRVPDSGDPKAAHELTVSNSVV